jgi:hypothetical protein
MRLKKRFVGLAALIGAIAALSTVAFATQGAHFFSTSSSVADNGALVVTWDEAGVGQQQVNYTLSADATALYACINNGGHNPKASNKRSFNGTVTAEGTFDPTNGRVHGNFTAGPLTEPSFTCPNGQTRVLAQATYTNIVLTDTTNNVTANIADASRCFFPNIQNLCT